MAAQAPAYKPVLIGSVNSCKRAYKNTLTFSPLAWLKLQMACLMHDTEIGGFGVVKKDDALYIEDFITIKQEVTGASVEFDGPDLGNFLEDMAELEVHPSRCMRVWLHTHPGNGVTPSSVDESTFKDVFGKADWSIMFILGRQGATYCRIQFTAGPGMSYELNVDVDWGSLPEYMRGRDLNTMRDAWLHEFNLNINERRYQTVNYGRTNHGNQNYHGYHGAQGGHQGHGYTGHWGYEHLQGSGATGGTTGTSGRPSSTGGGVPAAGDDFRNDPNWSYDQSRGRWVYTGPNSVHFQRRILDAKGQPVPQHGGSQSSVGSDANGTTSAPGIRSGFAASSTQLRLNLTAGAASLQPGETGAEKPVAEGNDGNHGLNAQAGESIPESAATSTATASEAKPEAATKDATAGGVAADASV